MNELNIKHQLINHLQDNAQFKVEYYSSLHDPELKHNTGFSALERLEMAHEALTALKSDIVDYKRMLENNKDPFFIIKKYYNTELQDGLKELIRQHLRRVNDFSENIYIVWGSLRTVIYCKNWLDKLNDSYTCVSPRYFLKYN